MVWVFTLVFGGEKGRGEKEKKGKGRRGRDPEAKETSGGRGVTILWRGRLGWR